VFEDRSLEGATPTQVREAFKTWVLGPQAEAEIQIAGGIKKLERGIGDEPDWDENEENLYWRAMFDPRYRACIQIDEEALQALFAEIDKGTMWGCFKVINVLWELPDPEDPEVQEDLEEGEDPLDEGYEPIEGCRLRDIGWMRMQLVSLSRLEDDLNGVRSYGWDDYWYRRPPLIYEDFS
jgi:hypothetical protein